jgi:hypothetical protein
MTSIALVAALLLAAPPAAPSAPPVPPAPKAPKVPAMPGTPVLPPTPAARPVPRLVGEWPAQPSGKTVTLTESMSIDDALEKIADAAGWALAANTGRTGDRLLVLKMKDVAVETALRTVLEGTSLAAMRTGNAVTVAPQIAPVAEIPVLTGFDPPSGKKVTGSYLDVPAEKAIRDIASQAGWSIVLPPGLRGAIFAEFKATPAEEALKAVLSQSNLVASREGSVVTVSRESGPRTIIRGGRRQIVYDDSGAVIADDVRGMAEEARQAAQEAAQEARDAAKDAGSAGTERRSKVIGIGSTNRNDRVTTGDVTVAAGERRRDVVAFRGNVRMEPGSSARQVTAILGSVELEPGVSVDQEVVAIGGNVHVAPGAHVGKDAVSVGGEVIIDPGGVVEGEQQAVSIPGLGSLLGAVSAEAPALKRVSPWLRAGRVIAKLAVFFLLGLLVLVVIPARLDRITASLGVKPSKVLLTGLLGTLAMPVLTVLLVVTIVGIPLVAVQVIAILVAAVVGFTALALLVGRAIPWRPSRGAAIAPLAIGVLLVTAVSEIPVVGPMAMVTGWLFAFGAVLRTRFGQPPAAAAPAPLATTAPPSQAG